MLLESVPGTRGRGRPRKT